MNQAPGRLRDLEGEETQELSEARWTSRVERDRLPHWALSTPPRVREDLSEEHPALWSRARDLEDLRKAGAGVLEEMSEGLRISRLEELLDEPRVLPASCAPALSKGERTSAPRHKNWRLIGALLRCDLMGSEEESRKRIGPEPTELCTEREATWERKLREREGERRQELASVPAPAS